MVGEVVNMNVLVKNNYWCKLKYLYFQNHHKSYIYR